MESITRCICAINQKYIVTILELLDCWMTCFVRAWQYFSECHCENDVILCHRSPGSGNLRLFLKSPLQRSKPHVSSRTQEYLNWPHSHLFSLKTVLYLMWNSWPRGFQITVIRTSHVCVHNYNTLDSCSCVMYARPGSSFKKSLL